MKILKIIVILLVLLVVVYLPIIRVKANIFCVTIPCPQYKNVTVLRYVMHAISPESDTWRY